MNIELLRHATMIVSFKGINLLVDPMLGAQGLTPAIPNSPQPRLNPLVDLPRVPNMENINAILLTHIHGDHLDKEARRIIPKELPVFCQSGDEEKLCEYGFKNVKQINEQAVWQGITFIRTGGHHGTGEIGKKMGKVSGYVLQAAGEPSLYISGDTIWCSEVQTALTEHKPEVSVVFAGAAQFLEGDPITMTSEDVQAVCHTNPAMEVVAVHMEALNHCLLTRAELNSFAKEHGFKGQLYIPQDGEKLQFP